MKHKICLTEVDQIKAEIEALNEEILKRQKALRHFFSYKTGQQLQQEGQELEELYIYRTQLIEQLLKKEGVIL